MKFTHSLFDRPTPKDPWLWFRAVAIAFAILFVIMFVWAAWGNYTDRPGIDFVSFWAAARLASEGHPQLAYDLAVHKQLELGVAGVGGFLPFPYPPPFLMLILPLGLFPSWLGFILWVFMTGVFYVLAARRTAAPYYALAHPGVFVNLFIGQNGLLTSGIFMLGAAQLATAPYVAGAIWGLLIIKPQLAVLLPVAVIAGREWKVIAGGVGSSIAVCLAALLLFGPHAYEGFFRMIPYFTEAMSENRWPWAVFVSPFAFMRHFDVPQTTALLVHAAIALAAAWLTWRSWARGLPERVPVLAAATLLISPYSLTHDALLLLVPLGWFIKEREQPYVVAAVWICCLLPIGSYFGLYTGPNTVPIACVLCLWALHRKYRPLAHQQPATRTTDTMPSIQ